MFVAFPHIIAFFNTSLLSGKMGENKTNLDFEEIELKAMKSDGKNDEPKLPPPNPSLPNMADPADTELVTIKRRSGMFGRIQLFFMSVVTNITLEPAMFIFDLAGGSMAASYSQMLIDKSCNDGGYNSTVCDNLVDPAYKVIHTEVTDRVSGMLLVAC